MELWLTPLLILPGVGLLIMSTSVRYGRVHEEVHHLLSHKGHHMPTLSGHLYKRSRFFRNALVGLYISVMLFSLGGLLGGLMGIWDSNAFWIVAAFTGAGILCLLYASWELVRESILSLEVIEEHLKEIEI